MHPLTLEEAHTLALNVLSRQGFSQEQSQALARAVVAGERDECRSHGLYRLLNCVKTLAAGKVMEGHSPSLLSKLV